MAANLPVSHRVSKESGLPLGQRSGRFVARMVRRDDCQGVVAARHGLERTRHVSSPRTTHVLEPIRYALTALLGRT